MNAINYEYPPPKERAPKKLTIFDSTKTKYLIFDGALQSFKSDIPQYKKQKTEE